jgi:hypothetical protein
MSKGADPGDYYEFRQSEMSKGADPGDYYAPQEYFRFLFVVTPQKTRAFYAVWFDKRSIATILKPHRRVMANEGIPLDLQKNSRGFWNKII